MKKFTLYFFFSVLTFLLQAQTINLVDAGCLVGPDVMSLSGNDGGSPSRNIYTGTANNGSFPMRVIWAGSRWEVQFDSDGNGSFESSVHANSFASSPNPPALGTGTWTDISGAGCGNLTTFNGSGTQTSLPVELVQFSGNVNSGKIELYWKTASELDNDYFQVEKSNNGKDFESIGLVEGNGSLSTAVNYSFLDPAPFKGINYYRLKQVDFNGDYEYSEIISIQSNQDEVMLNVFPNPFRSRLTINSNEAGQIRLMNLNGQIIRIINIDEEHGVNTNLDLEDFAPGIYILEFISHQGYQSFERIVKQ